MKRVVIGAYVAVLCATAFVIALLVKWASETSAPGECARLPRDFDQSQLVGTWVAQMSSKPTVRDVIQIRADGTYTQTVDRELPFSRYASKLNRWSFELSPIGVGYLRLEDFRDCGASPDAGCDAAPDPAVPWADVCRHEWFIPSPGKVALTVLGFQRYDPEALRQFSLALFLGFEASPWVYAFEKQ